MAGPGCSRIGGQPALCDHVASATIIHIPLGWPVPARAQRNSATLPHSRATRRYASYRGPEQHCARYSSGTDSDSPLQSRAMQIGGEPVAQRPSSLGSAAVRYSGGDGDLAACFPGVEITHGLGYLVQRVAPVDARRQLAGFDELGEPFQVGGAFLTQDGGQPLAHE